MLAAGFGRFVARLRQDGTDETDDGVAGEEAITQGRPPGWYGIRPTFRRSTVFSCRSIGGSASFAQMQYRCLKTW